MSDFKIDRDVPMPERVSKYPFGDMEVGDSFFAPGKTTRQLQNAASHHRKNGMAFRSLSDTDENGTEGARIWRIK